jgi:hypothetical protein
MKNNKNNKKKSVQSILPIGEIRNNCVVLKDGGIRGILSVSTINFNLKSESEQLAIIDGYQQFLNTIDFPIQICIQSRKVDLDPYINILNQKKDEIDNNILKEQTIDYIKYIKKISEYADIMEKKFLVVVPSNPLRKQTRTNIISQLLSNLSPEDSLEKVKSRYLEFKRLSELLNKRIDIISNGLERCGVRSSRLKTQQLIDLYYKSYNPTISQYESLDDIKRYNIKY